MSNETQINFNITSLGTHGGVTFTMVAAQGGDTAGRHVRMLLASVGDRTLVYRAGLEDMANKRMDCKYRAAHPAEHFNVVVPKDITAVGFITGGRLAVFVTIPVALAMLGEGDTAASRELLAYLRRQFPEAPVAAKPGRGATQVRSGRTPVLLTQPELPIAPAKIVAPRQEELALNVDSVPAIGQPEDPRRTAEVVEDLEDIESRFVITKGIAHIETTTLTLNIPNTAIVVGTSSELASVRAGKSEQLFVFNLANSTGGTITGPYVLMSLASTVSRQVAWNTTDYPGRVVFHGGLETEVQYSDKTFRRCYAFPVEQFALMLRAALPKLDQSWREALEPWLYVGAPLNRYFGRQPSPVKAVEQATEPSPKPAVNIPKGILKGVTKSSTPVLNTEVPETPARPILELNVGNEDSGLCMFDGDSLVTAKDVKTGTLYVGLSSLCAALGVDPKNQVEKLREREEFDLVALGRAERGMIMLPVDQVPAWLFLLTKVKDELKPRLGKYRKECVKALYTYWSKHGTQHTAPATVPDMAMIAAMMDKMVAPILARQEQMMLQHSEAVTKLAEGFSLKLENTYEKAVDAAQARIVPVLAEKAAIEQEASKMRPLAKIGEAIVAEKEMCGSGAMASMLGIQVPVGCNPAHYFNMVMYHGGVLNRVERQTGGAHWIVAEAYRAEQLGEIKSLVGAADLNKTYIPAWMWFVEKAPRLRELYNANVASFEAARLAGKYARPKIVRRKKTVKAKTPPPAAANGEQELFSLT